MQQTTLYETVLASQYGKLTTFEVRAPTDYLAIDPRIWVKYTIKVSGNLAGFYHGILADGNLCIHRTEDKMVAWRQGWCVARAMQNVQCKLNDKTVVTHKPRDYIDPLTRMFMTDQEARTQSSGGAFDSDSMIHDEESDLINYEKADVIVEDPVDEDDPEPEDFSIALYPDLGLQGNVPDNVYLLAPGTQCQMVNRGFKDRRYKFWKEGMRNDETLTVNENSVATGVPTADTCKFELWEPLPIEPFALFPKYQEGKELSIVRRLELRITFEDDLIEYMACGRRSEEELEELSDPLTLSLSEAPMLAVRYIPRVIPPERIQSLNVHYADYKIFSIDRSSNTRLVRGEQDFTYDIAPDTDKIYFYMHRRKMGFAYPTEHFLGIESIQIKTPNADHMYDARQLFDNWNSVSHNHDLCFDDFRYTKSVACISVRELRLDQRLHMIVKWRNIWKVPQLYNSAAVGVDNGTVSYRAVLIMDKKVEVHT